MGRDLADATGGTAAAVLLGQGVIGLAEALGKAGRRKVFLGDDALFAQYSNDAYGLAVGRPPRLSGRRPCSFRERPWARTWPPKVTARLGIGLLSDATTFSAAGGAVTFQRPILRARPSPRWRPPPARPSALPSRPNVFPVKDNPKAGEVVALDHGVTCGRHQGRGGERSSPPKANCWMWPRPTSSSPAGAA